MAMYLLKQTGERRESRNGPVYVASGPVTTVYEKPQERVMFWAERDCNPFFHFFESLWMLGGRNDVESVARFAGNMANYSDDGRTFHGAYGYRWRIAMPADVQYGAHTPYDQLQIIADRLRIDPNERRTVLQMWDSASDLGNPCKDVPCNTVATFQMDSEGELHICVFNRSNDIIWGAYGANAVQFSTLLEYVACRAGAKIGTYHQISVNWHAYPKVFDPLYEKFESSASSYGNPNVAGLSEIPSYYETGEAAPYPLMQPDTNPDDWDLSLRRLLAANGRAPTEGRWCDPFFTDVAIPILRAHDFYKAAELNDDKFEKTIGMLANVHATDWRLACFEWVTRRWNKYRKDRDDGPTP